MLIVTKVSVIPFADYEADDPLGAVLAVQRNQSDLAAQWIPAAGQLLIPQTSHFAFIQAPELFNSLLWGWLKDDACA